MKTAIVQTTNTHATNKGKCAVPLLRRILVDTNKYRLLECPQTQADARCKRQNDARRAHEAA